MSLGQDMILVPKDSATEARLALLTDLHGDVPGFITLDPLDKPTKGVLQYPQGLPMEAILDHPRVTKAVTLRGGARNKNTVLITHVGPLPEKLHLGRWGSFVLKPPEEEPLRCYKCQRYGHVRATCRATMRCGVCSKDS